MGGTQSIDEYSTLQIKEIKAKYTLLGERHDTLYGNIQLYQHKESEKRIFASARVFQNKQDHQRFIETIRKRCQLSHLNISNITGYHNQVDENMCGNSIQLSVYGEWHEHTLQRQLNDRADRNDFYPESMFVHILYSLLSALNVFESNDMVHCDVRPCQIIQTELKGLSVLKLTHHTLVHPIRTNYLKALVHGEKTFLAPEAMPYLDRKEIEPRYDRPKADIYSLGMTLLYVATFLDPASHCYNFLNYRIDQEEVQRMCMQARLRYCSPLIDLIEQMLCIDPMGRPTVATLLQQVDMHFNHYLQDIKALQAEYSPQAKQRVSNRTPAPAGLILKKDNSSRIEEKQIQQQELLLQQQYKQQQAEQQHLMEQVRKQQEKPKTETSFQNNRVDNSDYGSAHNRKRLFNPNEDHSQQEEDKNQSQQQPLFAFPANQPRQIQSPQVQKESQWQMKSPFHGYPKDNLKQTGPLWENKQPVQNMKSPLRQNIQLQSPSRPTPPNQWAIKSPMQHTRGNHHLIVSPSQNGLPPRANNETLSISSQQYVQPDLVRKSSFNSSQNQLKPQPSHHSQMGLPMKQPTLSHQPSQHSQAQPTLSHQPSVHSHQVPSQRSTQPHLPSAPLNLSTIRSPQRILASPQHSHMFATQAYPRQLMAQPSQTLLQPPLHGLKSPQKHSAPQYVRNPPAPSSYSYHTSHSDLDRRVQQALLNSQVTIQRNTKLY